MGIKRSDETSDVLAPYILYLWAKRVWIISFFIAVFIVSFIIMRTIKNEYEVTVDLYVNRHSLSDVGPPSPASVAQLIQNPMILEKVKKDYLKAFDVDEKDIPIEQFVKQFETKTETLQDTTVRKDLSPIIKLSVRSEGTSETRFLMQQWIHHAVKEYGNYATLEALEKKQLLENEVNTVENRLKTLENELASVTSKLPLAKRKLAESLESLSPARLNMPSEADNNIDIRIESNKRDGLLARKTELELQLKSGNAPTTAPQTLNALNEIIKEIENQAVAAEAQVAALYEQESRLTREIKAQTELYTTLRANLNKFISSAALIETSKVDQLLPSGSDLRALSSPVLPEKKVWPPRTVAALAIAIAMTILNILGLLGLRYFSGIVRINK